MLLSEKLDLRQNSVTGLIDITCINSLKTFSQIIAECAIYPKISFLNKRVLLSFREWRNVDKNINFRNGLTSVTKFRTSLHFEFLVSNDYGFSYLHIKEKCVSIFFFVLKISKLLMRYFTI